MMRYLVVILTLLLVACGGGFGEAEQNPTSTAEVLQTTPMPVDAPSTPVLAAATATSTMVPSLTATSTLAPTNTPLPTATATMTPEPTVTLEPTATATPIPAPEPIIVTGNGTTLTEEPIFLFAGLAIFTTRNEGESNFTVRLRDTFTGDVAGLVANEIGFKTVQYAMQIRESARYVYEVRSQGTWEISVLQPVPASSEVHELPFEAGGSGPGVAYFVRVPTGFYRLTGTHNGSSNFVVRGYNQDASIANLLINEIGTGEWSAPVQVATTPHVYLVFNIEADGDWTIRLE